MFLLMVKFDLNPWIVAFVGTCGTTLGRLIYSTVIVRWIGKTAIGKIKRADLDFLGQKLSGKKSGVMAFVFLYSTLPLSTTPLFTASGLARVSPFIMIPPFFLGNLIGDAVVLVSGQTAVHSMKDIYQGSLDPKNILLLIAGLGFILVVLFIDWRELLNEKKLKLRIKFWR